MNTIRRHDLSPRVEMLPLIDVVFLLLTFFIYSIIMMVKAQVLPVQLSDVPSGQVATETVSHAITIDGYGKVFFNREPIQEAALQEKLTQLVDDPTKPMLFIAMEAAGQVDRGPILLDLIEQVRIAGIKKFTIVGAPAPGRAPGSVPGS